MRFVAPLVLVSFLPALPVVGQSEAPLQAGTRVRVLVVTQGSLEHRTGSVIQVSPSSLVMTGEPGSPPLVVPFGSVVGIERDAGRGSRALSWLKAGVMIGAVAGGMSLTELVWGSETQPKGSVVAGVLVGATVGAVAGSQSHRTKWKRVPLGPLRPDLLPGMMVRLKTMGGERIEGLVHQVGADSFSVVEADGGTERHLARQAVRSVEWPAGVRRAGREGTLIGTAVGLAAGIVSISGGCPDSGPNLLPCWWVQALGVVWATSAGYALGAAFGQLARKLIWEKGTVPLTRPERPAVDWEAIVSHLIL